MFNSVELNEYNITVPKDLISDLFTANELNILSQFFDLGKSIAYRDFREPTIAPFEILCDRCIYKHDVNDVDNFVRLAKQSYEVGFYSFTGKTYVQEIQQLAKQRFRHGL